MDRQPFHDDAKNPETAFSERNAIPAGKLEVRALTAGAIPANLAATQDVRNGKHPDGLSVSLQENAS